MGSACNPFPESGPGAADCIGVIVRGALLQLATPPEMRGRVSAVNSLFIGASNELGQFERGITAQWWSGMHNKGPLNAGLR